MFENVQRFETTFAGRPLSVETGKTCALSNGSCWVRYGDTVVMANVTASAKPREGIDFFPLSVDYEERMYSVGKIRLLHQAGGKPSEKAILTSRMVDRPIRPLFPKSMRNDVSVVMTVMAVDPDCAPDIVGMIATSIALSISDIPWNGPIAGISVGLVDGEIVLNPTLEQRQHNDLHLTVAGTKDKIVMIEAGANEVPEDTMLQAILTGHEEIKKMVAFISRFRRRSARKVHIRGTRGRSGTVRNIDAMVHEQVEHALDTNDKNERDARLRPIIDAAHETFDAVCGEETGMIDEILYLIQKKIVRAWLYEGKRVDGRGIDEIRPLAAEVGVLPRVHGTGLFTRGQTQVLTVATLGPVSDSQKLDGLDEETSKRYMHQYNFPSYSVGETKPSRGPGRREIGHGALAERALIPVLPTVEEFPYAMRLVSEVLSSNGSTSQASICGSTLALMDAGVPIHAPVAGISCGLITLPNSDEFKTMVDIQGLEDFYGDMDFKVGGTKKGITAIQVDIKVDGLTPAIIAEAFEKTRKARLYILDEIMLKAIPAPRDTVGEFAPKMLQIKIPTDKIRDVIGQGGKVIQKMSAECGVKIDVNEDGHVFISGISMEGCRKAYQMIETIAIDPEVGSIYKGKVVSIKPFGAFVEIAPGRDGLVHISKLDKERVEQVEDVVSVGDAIIVKVMDIKDGKISLSRKDALEELEARRKQQETE
ncbi:MAG: polyribonucleotide nucleotidyltransferase [Ruminococcus callidus]